MENIVQLQESLKYASGINSDLKSRRFIFYICISLMLSIVIQVPLYIFNINYPFAEVADYFSFFLLVNTLFLAVYWYLQIKPTAIRTITRTVTNPIDTYSRTSTKIDEISKALELYKGKKSDEKIFVNFIKSRLIDLPERPEFESFNNSTLMNDVELELFKLVLLNVHDEIIDKMKNAIIEQRSKSKDETTKENSISRLIQLTDHVTSRLKNEIELLTKRGNLYITIGSVITVAGGVILYFTVKDFILSYASANETNDVINKHDILSITARVSIILFIEVFAYYYLRLYKNIMDNVKFYQNEISNMELKLLALHAIENNDNNEALKTLTDELARTERNFVINKGQTTVDIEKSKHEQSILYKSIDSISKLVKTAK